MRLRPDLTWRDGSRCTFVGDVKYKQTDNGVPNADLYQLLAYTTALDLPGGLLIYAQGERKPSTHTVRHSGKRLEVAALDLSGTLKGDADEGPRAGAARSGVAPRCVTIPRVGRSGLPANRATKSVSGSGSWSK